jgi:hypothetical protein
MEDTQVSAPELALDDKAQAGFISWFRNLEKKQVRS